MRISTAVSLVVVGIFVLTAASCPPKEPIGGDPGLAKALLKAGWTPVDFPRELLGAGTIVSITQSQGIVYRGSLRDCVASDDDFKNNFQPRVGESGLSGQLKSSYKFDISALLSYANVQLGPQFNELNSFTVNMGDTKEYALSDVKVRNWIRANWEAMSPACKNYLKGYEGERSQLTDNIYVLTDVLGVDGYTYSFSTSSGAKINLTPANLSKYFQISGNGDYQTTASGDLKAVSGTVYIAFKTAESPAVAHQGAAAPSADPIVAMRARLRALHVLPSGE